MMMKQVEDKFQASQLEMNNMMQQSLRLLNEPTQNSHRRSRMDSSSESKSSLSERRRREERQKKTQYATGTYAQERGRAPGSNSTIGTYTHLRLDTDPKMVGHPLEGSVDVIPERAIEGLNLKNHNIWKIVILLMMLLKRIKHRECWTNGSPEVGGLGINTFPRAFTEPKT